MHSQQLSNCVINFQGDEQSKFSGESKNTQEISLFKCGSNKKLAHINRPSYGELPKPTHPMKQGVKSSSRNRSDLGANKTASTQKPKNTQQTRNQGEIFNYRLKSSGDQTAFKSQEKLNHYGSSTNVIINVDNGSESNSPMKRVPHQTPSERMSIAKSQSQQNFMGAALKKQQSSEVQDEQQKNDIMHLSLAFANSKPQAYSLAPDSQYGGDTLSQLQRNDSAYGDKQSEISSNLDRVDKQNIKVLARFRPLNDIERELVELNPQKSEMVIYDEDKRSLKLMDEYQTHSNLQAFTFDSVFSPEVSQEEVFEAVGRSMIEDIMAGYNGTIFAYGQTGSGKTFTMYGEDIFDDSQMGIVPRAAKQIFNFIKDQDLEVEYSIRIQMIEIYKETLRDLLHHSNQRPPELKIKEDPKRGTYVEGLQDICITSDEEIMAMICTGETMRHVASTQMNRVSSRSHSICVIDIIQKFPNDSERRGVLNLVDLAGSERVSRSMAEGSTLEEAKKINYSLSMLGKVIHSLTKHSSHIPYRDSKLTRLLKESLGGNNKTSLIVACSTHYSNYEETLSSLRFAQSAKHIQNRVKMNIKTSNDQLKQIISQLRSELKYAKEEIFRLRITSSQVSVQNGNNSSMLNNSIRQDNNEYQPHDASLIKAAGYNQSIIGSTPLQAIHNLPHQSLSSKNHEVIETNNLKGQMPPLIHMIAQELLPNVQTHSQLPSGSIPEHIQTTFADAQRLLECLAQKNEELEMKLLSKESDIEALIFQKDEMQVKIALLEEKNQAQKQKLVSAERQLAEYDEARDQVLSKEVVQDHKLRSLQNEADLLNQQVLCLQKALEESDSNLQRAQVQCKALTERKINEYFTDTLELLKLPASSVLQSLIERTPTENNILEDYMKESQTIAEAKFKVSLGERDTLMSNLYTIELLQDVEAGSVPLDVVIYILKTQLIDASLTNHSLQRLLHSQRWKGMLEASELQAKKVLCKDQAESISKLEELVERQRLSHDRMKKRMEKLEAINNQKATQIENEFAALWNDGASNAGSDGLACLTNRGGAVNSGFDTMKSINPNSQSLVAGSHLMNSSSAQPFILNMKTRFAKPITSKSVKRMFSSRNIERSPVSRASFGRSLQGSSLMNQYYNLKQNAQLTQKHQLSQVDSRTNGESGSNSSQQNGVLPNKGLLASESDGKLSSFENLVEAEIEKSIAIKSQTNQLRARAVSHCGQQALLTLEDFKHIEAIEQLKDLKDFLRQKLQESLRQANSPLLFAGLVDMNRAASSINSKILKNPRSSSPVTNENEFNLREEEEEEEFGRISDTSLIQRESAPQTTLHLKEERDVYLPQKQQDGMFMTQGSEYLLNSFGFQHPTFGVTTTANQYLHQVELVERLQEKIIHLREESDMQRLRADELKKAFLENRAQLEAQRAMMEKNELGFNLMLKDEIYQWEQALNKVKSLNESELQKKQREIEKLHQLLAKWIDSYQTLELVRSAKGDRDFEKLLDETIRHRESRMTLNEVLLTSQTPASSKETERALGPSSFMSYNRTLKSVQKQSQQSAFGQIKALRASVRSPPTQSMHQLKTPQGKGLYQPLATEGNLPSRPMMLQQHMSNAKVACISPSLKMMKSEQRGERIIESQKVIRGDTSPAVQHHSSLDDDNSDNELEKSENNLRDIANQLNSEDDGIQLKRKPSEGALFEEMKDVENIGDLSPSGSSVESSQIVLNLQSQSHQCIADSERNSIITPGPILPLNQNQL